MSSTNISEFKRDWDELAAEVGVLPGQFLKKIAFDLHGDIVRRTPVRTGRARASWFVSAGQPSDDVLPEGDYGAPSFPEGLLIDGRESVYIINNLPYVSVLEAGHSSQAPHGFVALALENLDAQLSERLHEL